VTGLAVLTDSFLGGTLHFAPQWWSDHHSGIVIAPEPQKTSGKWQVASGK
jgi:hypothetical protein